MGGVRQVFLLTAAASHQALELALAAALVAVALAAAALVAVALAAAAPAALAALGSLSGAP